MSEIIAKGQEADFPLTLGNADDLAFIMYTSGTTGVPKGVMIANSCLMSCLNSATLGIGDKLKPGYHYFSYLPLAHIFEVLLNILCVSGGLKLFFSQGDVRQIVNDLQQVKPNLMPGVPRIWVKFYQGAFSQIDQMSFIKRWYIYRAYNYQLNQMRTGQPLDTGYDQKVFSVLREKLGLDNIAVLVTGAAPTPAYLVEFYACINKYLVLTRLWYDRILCRYSNL
eukprot:UN02635